MQALQLKITLQGSRPPIWRRILARPEATFWDLHSIIQDCFGWSDDHLHGFRRADKRDEDRHYFEVNAAESFGAMRSVAFAGLTGGMPREYYYEERKEKLGDWLSAEHPKFVYTYDFGDNWQHDILYEKTVETDDFKLARFLGGKRRGLEEDSRPEALLECTMFIKAADNPEGEDWKWMTGEFGKSELKKIVAQARREAASQAPETVSFTDPKERYRRAKANGMIR